MFLKSIYTASVLYSEAKTDKGIKICLWLLEVDNSIKLTYRLLDKCKIKL